MANKKNKQKKKSGKMVTFGWSLYSIEFVLIATTTNSGSKSFNFKNVMVYIR